MSKDPHYLGRLFFFLAFQTTGSRSADGKHWQYKACAHYCGGSFREYPTETLEAFKAKGKDDLQNRLTISLCSQSLMLVFEFEYISLLVYH